MPRLALWAPALGGRRTIAQVGRLIHGELEADGIDGGDGGEQRRAAGRAAGHEVADGDAPVADAAGDGRLELGELQIELGLADGRLLRR